MNKWKKYLTIILASIGIANTAGGCNNNLIKDSEVVPFIERIMDDNEKINLSEKALKDLKFLNEIMKYENLTKEEKIKTFVKIGRRVLDEKVANALGISVEKLEIEDFYWSSVGKRPHPREENSNKELPDEVGQLYLKISGISDHLEETTNMDLNIAMEKLNRIALETQIVTDKEGDLKLKEIYKGKEGKEQIESILKRKVNKEAKEAPEHENNGGTEPTTTNPMSNQPEHEKNGFKGTIVENGAQIQSVKNKAEGIIEITLKNGEKIIIYDQNNEPTGKRNPEEIIL